MVWLLSSFRAGDFVEIRNREEILASLDQYGCVDGMPFMPEMLQFCGQRFRVSAVAHKTCETARGTWKARRLQKAVHLASLRCDGSAHGGCQADCNLFWKDVWLKPADGKRFDSGKSTTDERRELLGGRRSETHLLANTRLSSIVEQEGPRYSCQATKLYEATQPLAEWDIRQYVFDVVTGNHSATRVLRVVWLASLRWLLQRVPFGYRLVKSVSDWMHQWLTGRASPSLCGKIKRGAPTPIGRLNL